MGLMRTCDHDGPGGRLFRFCGSCGKLIHPKMVPLSECERRHEYKRDMGYSFCVDCGDAVRDAPRVLALAQDPVPLEFRDATTDVEGGGELIPLFPGK